MKLSPALLLLTALLPAALHAEPSVAIVNKDYIAGTVASEWAQYTITTSGNVTVRNTANIRFAAGNSIKLGPGFKIERGGTFNASVSSSPSFSPGGFYTGVVPLLAVIGGDQQYGLVGQFNLQAFDIAIWNQAGTGPLVGAPVLLTVSYGGGWLSATNGTNAVLTKNLTLTTDNLGTVQGFYQHGPYDQVTSTIRVVAGTRSWEFTTYSYALNTTGTDTDGDGISNVSETLLNLTSTQPAQLSTAPELLVFAP
jgi:hypothetical protein